MKTYDYKAFQEDCAFNGFTYSLLTESQFQEAVTKLGADDQAIYSLACDVACGFDFEEVLASALEVEA